MKISMKRALAVLLSCVIILGVVPLNVIAEEHPVEQTRQMIVSASPANGVAGADVEVSISIENNPGIASMRLSIDFDSVVELVEVVYNTKQIGGQGLQPQSSTSPVVLSWYNEKGDSTFDGEVAVLRFKIKEEADVNTVSFLNVNYNINDIQNSQKNNVPCTVIGGAIRIMDRVPGDVNCDGIVTNLDITCFVRYVSGITDNNANKESMDTDADGRVSNRDIIYLVQYLADWDVVLRYGDVESTPAGKHTLVYMPPKEPTCIEQGNIEHWYCSDCGKYFEDNEARRETEDTYVLLDATGHTYSTKLMYDDYSHWYASTCEHIGEIKDRSAHVWDAGIEISPPTVYDEGEVLYTCPECGYEKIEYTYKLASFSVVFYDSNNRIVSNKKYALNTDNSEVTIPTVRIQSGYVFKAWIDQNSGRSIEEIDFSCATEDTVFSFKPYCVRTYNVTFEYYLDGKLVSTIVKMEEDQVISADDLPEIPNREGYDCAWEYDVVGTIVDSDLEFFPVYKVKTYTVTFLDSKGGDKLIDDQTVEYGSFAVVPSCDKYYFYNNSTNNFKKLLGFTEWRSDETDMRISTEGNKISNVDRDLVLYPTYENSIDVPVVAVHIERISFTQSIITMSLCMPEGTYLYSINMTMDWQTKGGKSSINSAALVDTSSLDPCENNGTIHIPKSDWLSYNNKSQEISFVWGCGKGHSFEIDYKLVTLNFGTNDNAVITEESFSVVEGSSVVWSNNNTNTNDAIRTDIVLWFY